MTSTFRSLALAAAAALLVAAPATAQGPRANSIGVKFGLAAPVGDMERGFEAGYTVGGMVELKAPTSPIAIRGELDYAAFESKALNLQLSTTSVGATVAWYMQGTQLRPYLLGGLAAYFNGGDFEGNDVGVNGGIGFEVPLTGFSTLFEARLVNVFNALGGNNSNRYVPITVGIRF